MSNELGFLLYGLALLVFSLLFYWLVAFFGYAVLRSLVRVIVRDVRDEMSAPKGPPAAR